jgi:hypothetical protein
LVKAGALKMCNMGSGNPKSSPTLQNVCPMANAACNPIKLEGGTCTDSVIENAKDIDNNNISLGHLDNYTFGAFCVQSNDIFLSADIVTCRYVVSRA